MTMATAAVTTGKASPAHVVSMREVSTVHFAERVAHARLARGLSMREVADVGGCADGTVSRAEKGRKHPRLGTVHRLALGLDVPASWLVDRGDVTEPPRRPAMTRDVDVLLREFAWRLGVARRWRGWGPLELGQRAGLGPHRWEQRTSVLELAEEQPLLMTVQRLAGALDAPAGWLVGEGEVYAPWAA